MSGPHMRAHRRSLERERASAERCVAGRRAVRERAVVVDVDGALTIVDCARGGCTDTQSADKDGVYRVRHACAAPRACARGLSWMTDAV